MSRRRTWMIIGLFGAGVLISAFSMRNGIDAFDEGYMLQAARRIAEGQVPYRDFLWPYGPAQPYLLAGLFKLFGYSMLDWRIVRVLADGGIALVAYLLLRDRVPRWLSLVVWLAVACEITEPRTADPFQMALLAALLSLWVISGGAHSAPPTAKRLIGAGALTAVSAAFRLDFGLYSLAGSAVTVCFLRPGARVRSALVFLASAVGLIVLVYLPFLITDGPADLYRALVGNSLRQGSYWHLPFPIHFHRPAGAGTAKTLKKALDFYVPLLTLIGAIAVLIATALRWVRARTVQPGPLPGLIVLGIGLLVYMLSRTDEFHVQPLFVLVVIALALVAGAARMPRAVTGAALLLIGLLTLHGVANRLSALVHPPDATTLSIAGADGVEAPPREAKAIARMVSLVDARVPSNDPIYVLPRRSDLVTINDPLIYFMTRRNNPTGQDVGLQTGARAQRQIVSALRRTHPRALVRWTDPASSKPEPNRRGRSSGVHTVDDWVAAHYRILAGLYHYQVLVPR